MYPKILVADNCPMFCLGLETAVGSEADIAVVAQAHDAADLIAKWHRMNPNVALVDILLPGLHDAGMLERILAVVPGRAIFLDNIANPGCAGRMLALGAGGYLHKCCAFHEMITAIRDVHGRKAHVCPFLPVAVVAEQVAHADRLAGREVDILVLIAGGMGTKEIAQSLGISVSTVKTYRARLHAKLDTNNDIQLARYAFTHAYASLCPDRHCATGAQPK